MEVVEGEDDVLGAAWRRGVKVDIDQREEVAEAAVGDDQEAEWM